MRAVAKVRPIPRRAKILYFPSPASIKAKAVPRRWSITRWPILLVLGILVSVIGEVWSAHW